MYVYWSSARRFYEDKNGKTKQGVVILNLEKKTYCDPYDVLIEDCRREYQTQLPNELGFLRWGHYYSVGTPSKKPHSWYFRRQSSIKTPYGSQYIFFSKFKIMIPCSIFPFISSGNLLALLQYTYLHYCSVWCQFPGRMSVFERFWCRGVYFSVLHRLSRLL